MCIEHKMSPKSKITKGKTVSIILNLSKKKPKYSVHFDFKHTQISRTEPFDIKLCCLVILLNNFQLIFNKIHVYFTKKHIQAEKQLN